MSNIPEEIGQDRPAERRDRVANITTAINDTVSFLLKERPGSVEQPNPAHAILVTNAAFLISNAYKRARKIGRTYGYKVAACHAAAVMVVRPVRLTRPCARDDLLLAHANAQCARRLSFDKLGMDPEKVDKAFLARFQAATLSPLAFPALNNYLQIFDNVVFSSKLTPVAASVFDSVENAVSFEIHNTITLSPFEMTALENLMNVYQLLERIFGNHLVLTTQGGM
ncbi:MAG: hypothetical protein ACRCWO_00070 [Bosea sp. (in: a-proteobacteria)]